MSFAPRLVVPDIACSKAETTVESVAKAARSMVMSAGEPKIVPCREMRRPFWSIKICQRAMIRKCMASIDLGSEVVQTQIEVSMPQQPTCSPPS